MQPQSDLIRNLLYAVAHCIDESASAASARQLIRARPASGTKHPEIKRAIHALLETATVPPPTADGNNMQFPPDLLEAPFLLEAPLKTLAANE